MKRFLALLTGIALVGSMAVGCSSTGGNSSSTASVLSGTITASGSSALYPLVNAAKNQFTQSNPNVSITLNAGGSGAGLTAVAQGSVDIGNSDVFAFEKLDADKASTLVDHQVAVIGDAVIVNSDVGATVTNLTTDQLKQIFAGTMTNWSQVGGPNESIVLVTRPSTSGTRATFDKIALQGGTEATSSSLETDDSGTLVAYVQNNKGAIGYVALSYLVNNPPVKTVSLDGVAPTQANIYSGAYKVASYEHMYTKGEAAGAVKAFIDYMVSDSFSAVIESMGYNTISKMQVKLSTPSSASSSASSK